MSTRVLVTGANGFIAQNLRLHLRERSDVEVTCFGRADSLERLPDLVAGTDFVFHLAGVNRPRSTEEFHAGNTELTRELAAALCAAADRTGRQIPVVYASSIQAGQDTPYGSSKREAEEALVEAARSHGIQTYIFRLPNVFGKWCRPNYNSVVATFCHNVARNLPIRIDDPAAEITLVYVDDVVRRFVELMDSRAAVADSRAAVADSQGLITISPQYRSSIGELAAQIVAFKDSRRTLTTARVGAGFVRALYATYMSYLPEEEFAYEVPQHADRRGMFAEVLKTPDCGQFSVFTAHPGVTRGGHYHHTKTEKFIVVKGTARFRFRHMLTGKTHELVTSDQSTRIVETVPGWTHDITNVGADDMIVMLWANELFDPALPDTTACAV